MLKLMNLTLLEDGAVLVLGEEVQQALARVVQDRGVLLIN